MLVRRLSAGGVSEGWVKIAGFSSPTGVIDFCGCESFVGE